jgi:hypothetical protein
MIPFIHAELSAKRFGGVPEDYLDIHELMDSSKAAFPNNAHRVLTHNSWFVVTILPKVFGHQRTNSAGKKYNVKDVGEYHILEDFRMKFIPSVQDYLENLVVQPWMNNGMGSPNRCQLMFKNKEEIEKYIGGGEKMVEEADEVIVVHRPSFTPEESKRTKSPPFSSDRNLVMD